MQRPINNPAIENILGRRSIRRFEEARPVSKDDVRLLLECACAAPSAHNYRPWHFIVIEGRKSLDSLAEVHPYGKMLHTATLAIAVCGELERGDYVMRFWENDCAAAMQNILLAANAVGLGAVWLGVRHGDDALEDRTKEMLNVPADVALMGIAAVGWPLETKDPHRGIDAHSIHINKW